ncbi:tyrosine-type recombinase/integrase [Mycolicibacterium nivoides]|uniref:tyrosine-type recombinase/integrase n=1 Tax=Mycolicibacterium nivoides TaxID=2487344 RepID=UPI001F150811|nr:site-specific integrase [Mycolicibacterium nivoides]
MSTARSAVYGKVTRWQVRWVDGSGHERSKSFDRKPDAQAYLNGLTADIQRGEYVDPSKSAATFGAVAEQWFETKSHRKPKTLAGYRSLLDTIILPKWKNVPLKAIDYQSFSTWIGSLSVDGSQRDTALSASRIRQTHQLVGAVLKYAQRSGLVTKNVASQLERKYDLPTEHGREQHALTREQLLGFVSHMRLYATLTLILGCVGIRTGEAFALRRSGVKDCKLIVSESATNVTGQGTVTTRTKTNKTREVAVPGWAWDRLVAELPADPKALVFPHRTGTTLTNHQYRYEFDKAVTAMRAETEAQRARETAETGKAVTPEFPTITPHDLRHTCASLLISTGANIKVVQRQLGHATAAMTLDQYGHLYDADLTHAADVLSDALEATAVSLRHSADTKKVRTG